MGNFFSSVALTVVTKLYLHENFRNTDEEYPDRYECRANYYKSLELPNTNGIEIHVPIYLCDEGETPSLRRTSEGNYSIIQFFTNGKMHEIDVLIRDIGLEHESTILGCNVCSALGLSSKLGLIYIYSMVPLPLPLPLPLPPSNECEDTNFRDSNVQGECPICFAQNNAHDLITTHCGHVFHNHCLRRWTVIRPTCPCCRTNL